MTKKKKVAIIIVCALLAIAVTFTLVATLHDDVNLALWKNVPTHLPEGFTITAHAGCEGTKPDTLEPLQKGWELGMPIVEFDVNFTPSGEPVLFHDTPQEGGSYLPFEAALAFLADKAPLQGNIDMKRTMHMDKVYEAIKKYDLQDRVFFTGIGEKDAPTVQRDCPGIRYYLNVNVECGTERQIKELIETTKKLGAIGVNLKFTKLSQELCDMCHENGLLVSVFTPDKMVVISHVLRFSPDNITTRRPTLVQKAIETRPKKGAEKK